MQIFGADINLDANSPDGQLNNIFAQAKRDVLEQIRQVAANFDPAQAVGVWLDRVGSYTDVLRQEGSYTLVNVDVTVDRAVTLSGIDDEPDNPFTIADSAGNKYYLSATHIFTVAGTVSLQFQAALFGPANPSANTLTVIQTVTLGVVSVNNPGAVTLLGTTEESDFSFRVRITQAVAKVSVGYIASALAAVIAVDGVTEVKIWENDTSTIDANSVPAHGVWIIVAFSTPATNQLVAEAIYSKRHAGTDQKGSISVNITQADGSIFAVLFDAPDPENVWVSFDIATLSGTVDATWLRAQILENFTFGIYQTANATDLVAYVKGLIPAAVITNEGVSDDGMSYTATAVPTTVQNQFVLANARIIINGTGG